MAQRENLQFLEHQIRLYRPLAFLVSGGGNDLFTGSDVGSTVFSQILNPKGSDKPYDNVRFKAFLAQMTANLLKVAEVGISLCVPTILHGYANAYDTAARRFGRRNLEKNGSDAEGSCCDARHHGTRPL